MSADVSSLRSRLILLQECHEVPEMKCADVQKPVEKTVHNTQCEIVSKKDCRVEQENVCRSVTEKASSRAGGQSLCRMIPPSLVIYLV